MKCNRLITSAENIKNNTGFFLLAIIIVLLIIVMIIFCCKGYNNLENQIDEVISNKFKSEKDSRKNKRSNTLLGHKTQNQNIVNNKNTRNKNMTNNLNSISLDNKNSQNFLIKKDVHDNNKNDKKNKRNKNIKRNNRRSTTTNDKKETDNEDDFMKYTNDYELNNLSYELALKYDKREFCDYYFSLIRTKQLIFFSFCDFNDYNSGVIKKFIFFLSFALHYTINALFFTDKVMHQIYQDGGKYNIIFQFPYITYSAIISTVIIRIILVTLVLTEKSILEIKNRKTKLLAEKKKKRTLKCVIIKYSIFFILNLILLILFWYYLTCFNALYANTQVDLIINTVISFTISMVYPFLINIIPAVFRNDILKNNRKTKKKITKNQAKESEYTYKTSQWLQLL